MPKGKAKTKFDFTIDPKTGKSKGCQYENGTWCKLPKHGRCENVIRCQNGDKACEVTAF
jgi:hypothetical protein